MPSLAITTKSQFQSGLWLFVKIDGLDKKERLETSIIMVTDNKNIIFEVLLFVKLTDKTRCFMQIADNILIFILTSAGRPSVCLQFYLKSDIFIEKRKKRK